MVRAVLVVMAMAVVMYRLLVMRKDFGIAVISPATYVTHTHTDAKT